MASIKPQARYPAKSIRRILVLEYLAGEATGAMYVTARLTEAEFALTRFVDISGQSDFGLPARLVARWLYGFTMPGPIFDRDEIDELVVEGTFVVIVRYVTRKWCRILKEKSDRLAGVAFLLDDMYDGVLTDPSVPWRHKLEIAYLYFQHARKLSRLCSELWVSTPKLLEHYRAPGVRLVDASFITPINERPRDLVRIFYHAEFANHLAELEWLVQVVREVQQRAANTVFEISGDDRVNKLYRKIERVRVVNRMSWRSYHAYTSTYSFDIGLAPLLETRFNVARSPGKYFDITRMGAAGIYSDVAPYKDTIRDGVTGMLVPNDRKAWVTAILRLVENGDRRRAIADAAWAACQSQWTQNRGLVRFIETGRDG